MFSFTADFQYIETALQSRWAPFTLLAREIESFEPRLIDDFEEERAAEMTRLLALNPGATEESIAQLVDGQIASRANPNLQFYLRFRDRFMTEYVTIAFMSHALCEATVNAILALGLATVGTSELFGLLEKADVKEKWRVGPKAFAPNYTLPKDSALYHTLQRLTKQRNALVHYKIELEFHGKLVQKGSGFARDPYPSEIPWMHRFFSLPYDLAEHARSQISDPPIMLLLSSGPIERAAAHRQT